MEMRMNESRIVIEKGCIQRVLDYVSPSHQVMIISDKQVPQRYKECLCRQLPQATLFEIPGGEQSKSMEWYQKILTQLLEMKFTRKDTLIALGGGIVLDLVGFVAATYKRGCPFISIPTTTLSQIDASVGGKVGINFRNLKNSVGAFYPASLVLIDVETLQTLPKRHFYNGLVEALKAGMLGDEYLYQLFLKEDFETHVEEMIQRAVLYKRDIVVKDPKEQGLRQILNYGHTIGHALESYFELDGYYHGECVANGILWLSQGKEFQAEIEHIFDKMNIPRIEGISKEALKEFITNDKKSNGKTITMAIVDVIGQGYLKEVAMDDVLR